MAQKIQTHDKKRSLCTDAPLPLLRGGGRLYTGYKKALAEKKTLEYHRIPKYQRDFRDYVLRYPNVERNNLIPTT